MRNRAFTILDVIVLVLAIGGLLFILMAAACGCGGRGPVRQIMNSTQLRGIHQSGVTYAQGNKGYYPGLLSTGALNHEAAGWSDFRVGPQGTPQNRYGYIHRLMRDDFFEPTYMINPGETHVSITVNAIKNRDQTMSDGIAGRYALNGSYAVLEYVGVSSGATVGGPRSTLGKLEWRDTFNTSAVVMADRELTSDTTKPRSIWTAISKEKKIGWEGCILFNDNHVIYELSDNSVEYSGVYGNPDNQLGTGTLGRLFNGIRPSDPYVDPKAGNGRLIAD